MPASKNRVEIIGNVGHDPEIRAFQNGGRVAAFSVATTERWKDKKTGEQKEDTEWHRIQVFSEPTIKYVEKHVHKGTHLLVEGKLQTRDWTDKDGAKKQTTEIVVRPFRGQVQVLSYKDSSKPVPDDVAELPEDGDRG